MEKNDLKSGMYVRTREGKLYLVIKDYVSCLDSKKDFLFINHDFWDCGCNYYDDLKNIYFEIFDIVEVLIPKKSNIFHIFHLLSDEELTQIWKSPTNPHEEEFHKTGYTSFKDYECNVKI